MSDVFASLRSDERVGGTLAAVSAFIDSQEGQGVSLNTYDPKAAIPYLAAFLAPLQQHNSNSMPIHAIQTNAHLLAVLLDAEAVNINVLRKKSNEIAEIALFNLLNKFSEDDMIARDAIKILSWIITAFEVNNHKAKMLQLKVLQALLVYSLDPREEVRSAAKLGVTSSFSGFDGQKNRPSLSSWLEVAQGFFSRELGLDGSNVGAEALSSAIHLAELLEDIVDTESLYFKDVSALFSLLIKFWAMLMNRNEHSTVQVSHGQLNSKQSSILVSLFKTGEAIFLRYSQDEDIHLFVDVLNALELPANVGWEAKIARLNTICAACAASNNYEYILNAASLVINTLLELTSTAPENVPVDSVNQCFLGMSALLSHPTVTIEDAFQWVNTLLGFRFRFYWAKSFALVKDMFLRRSFSEYEMCKPLVDHLIQLYNSSLNDNNELPSEALPALREALGAAVASFKTTQVVFKSTFTCETALLWILDIVREHINGEMISNFHQLLNFGIFSPLVQSKSRVLRGLWSTFPSFCRSMFYLDVTNEIYEDECSSMAPLILSYLSDPLSVSNCGFIGRGLVTLFSNPEKFTENFQGVVDNLLPMLCEYVLNLESGQDYNWMLEAIRGLAKMSSADVVGSILKNTLKLLLEMDGDDPNEGKQHLEICEAITASLGETEVIWLYKTARLHIQQGQGNLQKKSYKVLSTVLETHSLLLEKNGINVLQDLGFATSMETGPSVTDPASKRSRLRCLSSMIKSSQKVSGEFEKSLIVSSCGELILAVKEHGARTRQIGFELLGELCDRVYNSMGNSGIEHLFTIFIAGLAGSPRAQSGSFVCLRAILRRYKREIQDSTLLKTLQLAVVLVRSESREVAQSSLLFIQSFVSAANPELVQSVMQEVVDSLMFWGKDPKNRFKQHVCVTFERLVKKFGHEKIRNFAQSSQVCQSTAIIDSVAKDLRRKQRKKESNRAEYQKVLEKKKQQQQVKRGIQIAESEDKPLNLLDTSDKAWDQSMGGEMNDLSGSDNEEFKFTEDGKMIIDAESGSDDDIESDDGLEINSDDEKKTFTGKSMASVLTRRRSVAAASTRTQKTTMTTKTMKSVANSEKTNISRRTNYTQKKRKRSDEAEDDSNIISGSRFKAKRAGGDIRLAGQPEPFAFLGFHKKLMNKRLKHKSLKQFSCIVNAANKGAAAGMKAASKARGKRARTH